MKRKHGMPFGAEYLGDRGVRFRLWAPKPARIDILLDGSLLSMNPVGDGWFELAIKQASPGSRYQFVIDGGLHVPDPASRFQPEDVHGPSEVVDPAAFEWKDEGWNGRPWEEAAIYELHIGAFSGSGDFAGVEKKLDYLAGLGITAVEIMPVADFYGKRNWGYDGVLPYCPDSSYGRPQDLKRLVETAHQKNLMVLLDVVYNHFGPEGNYLRAYAPQFFTDRHCTPWGEAINFDGESSRTVRDFFIHNALYWLEEFHFDGLRFDAVHAIKDDSNPDILTELATTVRETLGPERKIHLVLENGDNSSHYLRRNERDRIDLYDAQWNDDIHHVCHILASGETDGYYSDYTENTIQLLGESLTEGFIFQGQISPYHHNLPRGEPSRDLPPTSFVSFLQNHDQVGNRAFGERILRYAKPEAVRAIMAILLLAPEPPLLFMGEEFAAGTPFLFFCDFEAGLAKAVTDGRRAEFARFAQFRDPAIRARIPDPNAEETFLASKLDWDSFSEAPHREWFDFYSHLLGLRQKAVVPLMRENAGKPIKSTFSIFQNSGLATCWHFEDRTVQLLANLGNESIAHNLRNQPPTYATFDLQNTSAIPPWSVVWYEGS